jgi:penicillin amidase
MDRNLAAPFLISLVYQHVRRAIAESAAPGSGATYDFTLAPAAIEKLLAERPAGWFADYDAMLAQALSDAVDEAARMQGRDPARWRYGAYWRVAINHPVLHQVPFVGHYFDIGIVPMSGAASTVKQTTLQLAPSMRMDADLGAWDRSWLNLQIGQSGQIFSTHYRDQWPSYYNGTSFPMQFEKVETKRTLQFRPAN